MFSSFLFGLIKLKCIFFHSIPQNPETPTQKDETICVKLSNLRKEFETKLYHARCAAERCADENANLQKDRNDLIAKLNEEEAAQKRAAQDAEKLRLTLRFERDLHRQELKEICKQSKVNNQSHQIQISEKYKAQMNDSLNALRGQLEDQLRLNHLNFDNQMKVLQGPALSVDAGGNAIGAIGAAQASLLGTAAQIADLKAKLADCQANVSTLEMLIKYWQKILDDDKTQMDNLQKIIRELCVKYQKLLDDKVKIQQELDAYNTMLQGEENRLKLAHMCDAVSEMAKTSVGIKPSTGETSEHTEGGDKKKYDIEIDISSKEK